MTLPVAAAIVVLIVSLGIAAGNLLAAAQVGQGLEVLLLVVSAAAATLAAEYLLAAALG